MTEDSKEVATVEEGGDLTNFVAGLPTPTDTAVAVELGGTGAYLPYLSVTQGSSPLCGPPHSWPQGVFALKHGRNEVHNLGSELDVFICDWRPKAMLNDTINNTVVTIHNIEDPTFEDFKARAEEKEKGYYWGFEFLLYHGKTGQFMTLFCNNPTLRRSARKKGFAYLHKKTTIMAKPITTKEYSWWGIDFLPLDTPFDHSMDQRTVVAQIEAFKKAETEMSEAEVETDPIDAPTPVADGDRDR